MNKLSLKHKIVLLSLVIACAMILLGAYGWKEMKSMDKFVSFSLNEVDTEVSLLMNVEQAHVHFKVQVQEWKNILLRGNDKEQFEKYLEKFNEEAKEVGQNLSNAMELMTQSGRDSSEIKSLIDEHEMLGVKYISALESYRQSDKLSGQKVDLLVKGLDRDASSGIQNIAHTTEEGFRKLLNNTKSNINQRSTTAVRSYTLTVAVLIVITLSIMLYVFYDIYRLLGGEPSEAAKIVSQVAEGRLDKEIHVSSRFKNSLIADIILMRDRLVSIVGEVKSSSDSLASASEEVNSTAQSLSQGASSQAASVEETSAAMEQMSASISQNNENANVTDSMAQKAAEDASKGGNAVSQTVAAMQKIAERISVIDDIAYQTNLLALNAAIEAGRAGEHGRGFAVVASEVRKLAERSQVAAQDIGELASTSVQQAELAGTLLDKIVPSIMKTADLVQEIAAASSEQTSGVQQINEAIGQVSITMQQNAAASEQLSATSHEMSNHAVGLKNSIDYFRLPESAFRSHSRGDSKVEQKSTTSTLRAVKEKRAEIELLDSDDEHFSEFNE